MYGCDNMILSHPDRKLIDHLIGVKNRSLEKFERISKFVNWEETFGFSKEDVRVVLEISSLLHDIGKATNFFQERLKTGRGGALTKHAPLSAYFVLDALSKLDLDPFLMYAGYSIVRFHHGRLKTPTEEQNLSYLVKEQLPKFQDSILEDLGINMGLSERRIEELDDFLEDISFESQYSGKKGYFLLKLLFSILVASDREDVILREGNIEISKLNPESLERYIEHFKIRKDIDLLRKEFQKEVKAFEGNGNIFSITAPTGIGKTLANVQLAFKIRSSEDGILVYALPLINIIEQTADVMRDVFGKNKVLEYHHLSDPFDENHLFDEEYLRKLRRTSILYQTWSFPMIITTFVTLLENLIGGSKAPFLHRLPGGVLILDEIQAIPHEKWGIVREVLEFLPKLGIRIIFSTATMPAIFKGTEVIKRSKFKNLSRVKLRFKDDMNIEDFKVWLKDLVNDGVSTLIVMNTIKTAEEIYKSIASDDVCFLSSRVAPVHRRERIKAIKNGKYRICVSTQVIEAGVDISFERVVRDIAPLDSIVQTAGRCNRHFENELGEIIVVPIKKDGRYPAKSIYGKFLIEKALEYLQKRPEMDEIEFRNIVNSYFSDIENFGGIDEKKFIEKLNKLDICGLDSFRIVEDTFDFSFLILLDEKANQIFEKALKVSEDLSGIEKRLVVSSYLRRLSPYVITTFVSPEEKENIGAFEIEFGMVIVRNEYIEDWYDSILGLRLERGEALVI